MKMTSLFLFNVYSEQVADGFQPVYSRERALIADSFLAV